LRKEKTAPSKILEDGDCVLATNTETRKIARRVRTEERATILAGPLSSPDGTVEKALIERSGKGRKLSRGTGSKTAPPSAIHK